MKNLFPIQPQLLREVSVVKEYTNFVKFLKLVEVEKIM